MKGLPYSYSSTRMHHVQCSPCQSHASLDRSTSQRPQVGAAWQTVKLVSAAGHQRAAAAWPRRLRTEAARQPGGAAASRHTHGSGRVPRRFRRCCCRMCACWALYMHGPGAWGGWPRAIARHLSSLMPWTLPLAMCWDCSMACVLHLLVSSLFLDVSGTTHASPNGCTSEWCGCGGLPACTGSGDRDGVSTTSKYELTMASSKGRIALSKWL